MVAASKIFVPDSGRSKVSRQSPLSTSRWIVEAVAVTLITIYFGCFRPNAKCNQRRVMEYRSDGSARLKGRIDSPVCWAGYKYSRGNDSITRVYHPGPSAHQGHRNISDA